jgi:hypothetical protein
MLKKLISLLRSLFFKQKQTETRQGPIVAKKIQFILKQRDIAYTGETEEAYSYGVLHSGLFNSARFVVDMLNAQHGAYEAELIHVNDNNCIDREVTRFKPDVVIIEAYWVVPEKFEVLTKLHPKVKWIIRNHSKAPFLANEGIAFDWTLRYTDTPNVYVSSNSENTNEELAQMMYNCHDDWTLKYAKERCPFLPNYYPIDELKRTRSDYKQHSDELHIGCFGAIRPLKNHMIQAIAAIKFANKLGKKLFFHINGSRIEGNGNNVLKNLRAMFSHMGHELVEHEWMKHEDFLEFVGTMDYGLQVSYTETFNIVAADLVSQGVPTIVSDEIDWINDVFVADPNSSDDIVEKLRIAHIYARQLGWVKKNQESLRTYNEKTKHAWTRELERLTSQG